MSRVSSQKSAANASSFVHLAYGHKCEVNRRHPLWWRLNVAGLPASRIRDWKKWVSRMGLLRTAGVAAARFSDWRVVKSNAGGRLPLRRGAGRITTAWMVRRVDYWEESGPHTDSSNVSSEGSWILSSARTNG